MSTNERACYISTIVSLPGGDVLAGSRTDREAYTVMVTYTDSLANGNGNGEEGMEN